MPSCAVFAVIADIACICTAKPNVPVPLVNGLITRNYATRRLAARVSSPSLVLRIPSELHNNIQPMGVETLKRPI